MHPDRTPALRFLRNGMEPLLVLLAVVVLRRFGLAGDTPLWVLAAILLPSAVYQQPEVQRRLSGGDPARALWARAGLHIGWTTAVMYLTGWGALPAIAHLHVLSMYLRQSGSRAWRPVAAASVLSIAAGELAVATGLVHAELPRATAHGIAALIVLGVVTTARVMSQTVRQAENAERAVRTSEERFRALVRDGGDVIVLTRRDGSVSYVSPAAETVTGFAPELLLGRDLGELCHPDDRRDLVALRAALLAGDGSTEHTLELRVRHADGAWHWHELIARNLLDNPAVGAVITHHRDITERRLAQDRIAYAAGHDGLTGLVNGPTLLHDLELALRHGTRYQFPVGLLFLDLDGFKSVNDTYGHHVGDRLLQTISEVITRNTRDTDVAGRLGGDEFGVVLTRVNGADEARTVAARIIAGIANHASVAGLRLEVGCSVGIALAYPGGTDAATLLRHADTAMYRSKRRTRNGCEIYVEDEVSAPWL